VLQSDKLDCVAFADLQPYEPVRNGAPDHVVTFGALELATPSGWHPMRLSGLISPGCRR
jgi:hypothetical protein